MSDIELIDNGVIHNRKMIYEIVFKTFLANLLIYISQYKWISSSVTTLIHNINV